MHTKDLLAQELFKAGLTEMAEKAAEGYYHDFLSPLDNPCLQLVIDLVVVGTPEAKVLLVRLENGEFDASLEESNEWANSPEGQECFNSLTNNIGLTKSKT